MHRISIEAVSHRKVVATAGAAIVGKVTTYIDSNRDLVVLEAWVEPEYRRKGIATALYRTIESTTGRLLKPDKSLSDDAIAFWRAYRPGALPN